MVEFLTGLKRSYYCGELSKKNVGEEVTVMGWIHRRRDLGSLIFVQVRDRGGIVQAVFDETCAKELSEKAGTLKLEYVVAIRGIVRARTPENVNTEMKTGEVEILANELRILSEAQTLPFSNADDANEALRLKYRYLDLRRPALQQNLIMRSKIAQVVRNYLSGHGFLEIETPVLGRSTPEGARDYLVPSRVHHGQFYALPQSPQQYKQLLMIAGMDRYFQIVKCFRDEDLRANRQPEFTQIDIEMSFVDREDDVIEVMEGMVKEVFREIKGIELPEHFRRMPYQEAMERYGSDKPDLRFDMPLCDLSEAVKGCGFGVFESALAQNGAVRGLVLKGHEHEVSRKEIDKLTDLAKTYRAKGLAWAAVGESGVRSSFVKFVSEEAMQKIFAAANAQQGDLLFIVADADNEIVCNSLGALRCELAEKFGMIDKNRYEVLWVVDFPLLEYDYDEKRYVAKHHPFTSPKNEDLALMKTHPEQVRAKAYDIVINGQEAGGGSIRIFNQEVQKLMFQTLGFTEEQIAARFGYFVEAFRFGTPPHGGIAFGLDRLTMLLTGAESIKDVIAFPKVQNASDLMMEAPNVVDNDQLKELGICLDESDE